MRRPSARRAIAFGAPFVVAVALACGALAAPSNAARLAYRWPNDTIYNHAPQLRFRLDERVLPSSLRAWVDGKLVSRTIYRNSQWFYFASPRSLAMGNHTVRVRGVTDRGDRFDVHWTFYQAAY